jgi:hypothetical protein
MRSSFESERFRCNDSGPEADVPSGIFARTALEVRLADVETLLEVPADALAAREHRLEPDATGRELHDLHVTCPVAVAARVRSRLVEGP